MERSIAKPLSGPEIIEAIVYSIRENLSKNCLLAPHMAYPAFKFKGQIDIDFSNPGSNIKEAKGFISGSGGEPEPGAETKLESVTVSEPMKAPNEVRRDTEQGVPVHVDTPKGGVEEKKVKYQKQPKGQKH